MHRNLYSIILLVKFLLVFEQNWADLDIDGETIYAKNINVKNEGSKLNYLIEHQLQKVTTLHSMESTSL